MRLPRVTSKTTPGGAGQDGAMFFFFSNRMGCLPSLLLSVVVTIVLLVITGVLR